MKRSDFLMHLSREHHTALVMAKRLKALPDDSNEAAHLRTRLLDWFEHELVRHFAEEEALLARLPVNMQPLADRTKSDHMKLEQIRRRIANGDVAALRDFGELLGEHVRFEERILFPSLESCFRAL